MTVATAVRALDHRAREIKAQQRASERKAKTVAELAALAQSRYYDAERAAPWMRGRRQELSGKSPEEFTIDDTTGRRCSDLYLRNVRVDEYSEVR